MAAIVAIAGARVEQRVATEERRTVAMRPEADVAHCVSRRIQAFELDGLADLDDIAGAQPAIDARDPVLRVGMCQHLGAGRRDYLLVAAGVVAVLMGVEDLCDRPPPRAGESEALLVVERIDREGLAGLPAGDEVVEVAIGVRGP